MAQSSTPEGPGLDTRPALSRRSFMRAIGAAVATGPVLGVTVVRYLDETARPAAAAQTGSTAAHRWVMVIDMRRCDGCTLCTKACQAAHWLAPEQTWINVFPMTGASGKPYFMPRPCMQCDQAPCVKVCPVGASFHTDDGVVLVDQSRCIGCRMCMAACPYQARYFNWTDPPTPTAPLPTTPTPQYPFPQVKGTVGKCTLCSDRLPLGKVPHCVEACGMGVLYIGDQVTDVAVNGLGRAVKLSAFLADNDAFRYKDELNTGPRVYYIAGHDQLQPETT